VDIILVDETHSASVVHHNDVGSDRENSIPTFAIRPHTRSIDLHGHHHKDSLKARSRTLQFSLLPNSTVSSIHTGFTSFQSFYTPASSISDGYEPYHPPNPLLFLTRTRTRTRLRPPCHSTITDRITRCWHRRCQPQHSQRESRPPSFPHDTPMICARGHRQSHPVRCADPRYSLPRPKRAQGYRRYLHPLPAVS
jgi:hypothetical protein